MQEVKNLTELIVFIIEKSNLPYINACYLLIQ